MGSEALVHRGASGGGGAAILMLSVLVVVLAWTFVIIDSEGTLQTLSAVSSSIRHYARQPGLLIGVGFAGSLVCVLLTSLLLLRSMAAFIAIWIFTLSVAEAAIPLLQLISLVIRYSMMASIIVAGLYGLLFRRSQGLELFQYCGFFLLIWIVIEMWINPVDTNALLMLPMQAAMFLGIFIGLHRLIANPATTRKIAYALVLVGMASVVLNGLALLFAPNAYVGGRFSSWYELPTSFSNNFVLCLTPVVWALLESRRPLVKTILALFVMAGMALIILSGTRNATLVLLFSILLMTFLWKRRYIVYVVIAAMLIGLVAATVNFGLDDLGSAGTRISHVSDKEARFHVWERAIVYIFEKPWVGYGLSTDLAHLDSRLPVWEQFNAHNAFLGLWLRLGVIGMLAYVVIYVSVLAKGTRLLLKRHLYGERDLSVLVLFFTLLSNLCLAGIFEENLSSRASLQQAEWAIALILVSLEIRFLRQARRLKRASTHQPATSAGANAVPSLAAARRIAGRPTS